MDGGHLGREILLLLLVWQLVESVKLWHVVRNYEHQAKKRRSRRKKRQKRSPQEFQGLTKKPLCELCVADEDQDSPIVRAAPPLLIQKRGRPRQVDTAHQYCPNEQCEVVSLATADISDPRQRSLSDQNQAQKQPKSGPKSSFRPLTG